MQTLLSLSFLTEKWFDHYYILPVSSIQWQLQKNPVRLFSQLNYRRLFHSIFTATFIGRCVAS
jgi:hypothetical protein